MHHLNLLAVVFAVALAVPASAQAAADEATTFKPAPPAGDGTATKKKVPPPDPTLSPAARPQAGPAPTPAQPDNLPTATGVDPPAPLPAGAPAPPPPPAAAPGGYPPAPGYPPPGYFYPGCPPLYGYPPQASAYPGYPPYPYPNAYYPYQPSKQPGSRTHDGFYLGAGLGISGFSFSTDGVGQKIEMNGSGVALEFSLGAALTPHLILYGSFYEVNAVGNATVKVAGMDMPDSYGVKLLGIGPGVTYYIGEQNYFVSGVLAFSRLNFEIPTAVSRTGYYTDWGVALKASVGREWWLSDNWGLGVAGQIVLGSMPDSELVPTGDVRTSSNPSWGVAAFSLLLSASFN